jgi:hypothetical protein
VPSKLTPQSSATHASLAQDIVPIRCYSQKEDVTQVAELELEQRIVARFVLVLVAKSKILARWRGLANQVGL